MSLKQALEAKFRVSEPQIARYGVVRWWWEYAGPDCAPFRAYLRLHRDRITLADITGVGERTGRMPVILDAIEDVAAARYLDVRVEAVVNPSLHRHLLRRGYLEIVGDMDLVLPSPGSPP